MNTTVYTILTNSTEYRCSDYVPNFINSPNNIFPTAIYNFI